MRHLILSFFILFSACAMADDDRFIQVTGAGVVEAMPDYLQVNLSIQATESNLKKAKSRVDKAMKQLLKEAANLSIAEDDIEAAHISNQPQYEWRDNQREYRGEQINRNVNITLRDKKQYTDLAHRLLMINEVRIHNSQLKFNDRQSLQNQAFAKAVKAATAKAQLIANASNSKLGDVISVQEQGANIHQPVYAMAQMEHRSMDSEPAPMLIQRQTIEATVVVRYEIR